VYECACRAARANPCTPTQVCMMIGQPFTDFLLEHRPRDARRVTQAEALQLLRDEHARGHLHAAYFKDVMLNRMYAICNCCGCCCGGIEFMQQHGVPMIVSSGYVAEIDAGVCSGCGVCAETCPFDAIMVEDTGHIVYDRCLGCGVCEGQCAEGAITLQRDPAKGEPLDVRVLGAGE
ncbi:MAG: 4Fe-4S dicluster domain-containing protein, partial [Chloroflexi bacterium]|nr:4Fe-4S dicluster domain-containing protein [Chloroflexota bacterium]